jgi:hypothetical protein
VIEYIKIKETLEENLTKKILINLDMIKSFYFSDIQKVIFYDISKDIRDYVRIFGILKDNDNLDFHYLTNNKEYDNNEKFYRFISKCSKNNGQIIFTKAS